MLRNPYIWQAVDLDGCCWTRSSERWRTLGEAVADPTVVAVVFTAPQRPTLRFPVTPGMEVISKYHVWRYYFEWCRTRPDQQAPDPMRYRFVAGFRMPSGLGVVAGVDLKTNVVEFRTLPGTHPGFMTPAIPTHEGG